MNARICVLVAALAATVSCGQYDGPVLTSSDLVIYAPLPGRTTSVAYMTLQNHSQNAVVLRGAHSALFARVEMHETVIADGVAHMRALESLRIDARSSVEFAVGGRHIMLIEPNGALGAGDPVSLELRYDDGGLLLLQAPLSTRTAN
jgi:copper(I)-binding protein